MKIKALTASILLITLLGSTACSLPSQKPPAPTTKTINTFHADNTEAIPTYQPLRDLNSTSASTVVAAKEKKMFEDKKTSDGRIFINHVGGYKVTVPDTLEVVDMGDATYRAVLANDNMRLEIFAQPLTVDKESYLGYSNKFLTNNHDFTNTKETERVIDGRTVKVTTWQRRTLSKIKNDRNYYTCIDIVEGKNSYNLFFSATASEADTLNVEEIIKSFDTFTPDVEGLEYERHSSNISKKNDETQKLYQDYFSKDSGLTWGLFEPISAEVDYRNVDRLHEIENKVKHDFKFLLHYTNIHDAYKEGRIINLLKRAKQEGATVELTLQTPIYDATANRNMVYEILEGTYDDYLHAYAKDIADFGHPVLFRPFNEMNGDWCTYSAFWASRDCNIYVSLYRYLYQIFEEEGATQNTLWIWNPNEKSFPDFPWNHADNYYPGDEYVDIVGLTGYNTGDYYEGETWRSFNEIYDPLYKTMAPQYQQPLMITEFASSSIGGDKPDWVKDMFKQLRNYPRIKVAVWWNGRDMDGKTEARPYYIDDSKKTVNTFKHYLSK